MIRLTLVFSFVVATACTPAMAQEAGIEAEILDAPTGTLGWALKPALEGLDDDGDGLYSAAEIGGTTVPEEFDLDGDGLFSVVELSQGYWAAADADRSGVLEDDELRAMGGLPASGVYEYDM
ncbi:MAG: hypothetical protein AAF264_06105 [Pseudomonadota bacterium]